MIPYDLDCSARVSRFSSGASGLLGSAVYDAFKKSSANHTVLGLAHSRSTAELKKLDLLDYEATERTFSEFKPDCEFHRPGDDSICDDRSVLWEQG